MSVGPIVLSASFALTGAGSLFRDDTIGTSTDSTGIGVGLVPALSKTITSDVVAGTVRATKYYRETYTIAAGATLSLDLTNNLIDPLGNTLTFASIRAVLVVNLTAGRLLRVGPQGVTNAFVGPIKGHASAYLEFADWHHWSSTVDYTVAVGVNDIYAIKNDDYDSSGLSANVFVWILGV